MAGAVTISEIRQWMNDTFVSKVEDQLNREIMAVELFKKHNTGFTDGQAIVPINYARNTSAGYRAENDTLPNAGELGRARLAVDAKYLYSRMSLTGPAIESGRNNPNGLKATLQEEIDGALESLSNRCNNYLFSGGGCVGYVMFKNADMGSADCDFFGNAEHLNASGGAYTPCRLYRMDTYATIDRAGPVALTGIKLGASTSATSASTARVEHAQDSSGVPAGVPIAVVLEQTAAYANISAGGTETVADQPLGIMSNLSTPSHFAVDRTTSTATWASLQSNFHSGSITANGDGFAFASTQLQALLTQIQRQSEKRPEMFFVEHGFMDQYISVLTTTLANGNFRINQTAGKGADAGFNTQQMTYGGVPFRASRDAPKGCVIALTPSVWAQVTLKSPGMADLDGSVLSRQSNLDAWEAFARYYHNLCCKRPNANGILTGVAN